MEAEGSGGAGGGDGGGGTTRVGRRLFQLAVSEEGHPHALGCTRGYGVARPLLRLFVGERSAHLPRVDERRARRAAARAQAIPPHTRASLDDEDARVRRHGGEHEVHLHMDMNMDMDMDMACTWRAWGVHVRPTLNVHTACTNTLD